MSSEHNKSRDELISEIKQLQEKISSLEKTINISASLDKTLRNRGAIYSFLVENTGIGFAIVDENGIVIDTNQEYIRLTGNEKPEDVLGKNVLEWTAKYDLERNAKEIKECLKNGERKNLQIDYECKNGEIINVEINARVQKIDNSIRILTLSRDITHIKKTQKELENLAKELRQSQNNLESIIDSIPDVISVQDKNHNVIKFNSAGYKFLNKTPEEVIGRKCYELIGGEKPCDVCAKSKTIKSRKTEEVIRFFPSAGLWFNIRSYPVLDETGDILFIIEHMRDITKEKNSERALANEKDLLEKLMETSPIGISMVDAEGKISKVNKTFADMCNCSKEELTGRMFNDPKWEITDWNGRGYPEDELPYSIVMKTKKPVYNICHSIKNIKGENIYLSINAAPFLDEKGNVIGIIATIDDRTPEQNAESRHKKLESRIQNAQKLESLGILAGGIAHDFNNLLMGILGNVDLALSEISPASGVKPYLNDIEESSRKAAALCQQMLAYSGKGRFIIEPIYFNDLIKEMTHIYEVSVKKKTVIKYDYASNLLPIDGDMSQIRQLLVNLIINSSEAIGEKSGIISIRTGAMECDKVYLSETYLDDNLPEGMYVYIEISDTGCGMSKDVKDKIFDPFFTTKFMGRGLGMAAVLGIVRGHKGAIKIYSEISKGTTIKVLFPPSAKSKFTGEQKEANGVFQKIGSGTILIVDDEETVRVIVKKMLEKLGFTVLLASDGLEALEIYKQNRENIKCILLDLTMPRLDGEETFRELRRINRDICVIISSGYNENEINQRFIGKGISGFIQKPYQISTLRDKILEIFQKRQKDRE